jgi:hypothetical protein
VDTYPLNTSNPIRLRGEDWALTVRSNPSLASFLLGADFVATTDFSGFWAFLPQGAVLPRPRSDADALGGLYAFDATPDLDALAAAQGVAATTDVESLATDDWPEDESVEDFIAAAMEGRHEEDEPGS